METVDEHAIGRSAGGGDRPGGRERRMRWSGAVVEKDASAINRHRVATNGPGFGEGQ